MQIILKSALSGGLPGNVWKCNLGSLRNPVSYWHRITENNLFYYLELVDYHQRIGR